MGLFDFLLGKTIRIEDNFYGQLLFFSSSKKQGDYFEGRRYFKPSGKIIELAIDADSSGPTHTHKHFFENVERNYADLIKKSEPLICNEFRKWKPDFEILNFNEEFTPVYLEIPKDNNANTKWEIAFETVHDEDHTITITVIDFTPTEILIDG